MTQTTDERQRPILVVEDDEDIARLLEIHIRDAGHESHTARDGKTGLDEALTGNYAALILDLMLPGMDGYAVCRKVREKDPSLPILMLTARSEEFDKVLGLELGADDYLTKPFSIREFVARLKALLRRAYMAGPDGPAETEISLGDLEIDLTRRRVALAGENLDLTAKEWELLVLFAQNPGKVFTREELLNKVWGYQYDGYSHTVNTHINRLRNKIESDPSRPTYIITKRGLGYRFAEADELEASS